MQNNQEYKLIDTHAHLCDQRLNPEEIILNMKKDNLDKIITVGYDMPSSRFSVALAAKNKDVYAAAGVHPSDIKNMTEGDLDELFALSKSPKCVAVGEIGLDYHYDDANPDNQKYWFKRQLEVVENSGLPCVLHIRDAEQDTQRIIKENISRFRAPAVLHCFSGSKETAAFYLSLGFYISFTGVITYQNAVRYADIIKSIPKDRLLIETDCPYLTPEPFRGRLNNPANVRFVAEKTAQYLGITASEAAAITRENAYRLFGKMQDN